MKSRYNYRTPIPTITSSKGETKAITFKKGIDTYKDNDDVGHDQLLSATDGRMVQIGRYKTRKGIDRYSVPVGEAINVQLTSTTGESTYGISYTSWAAQKLTAGSSGRATKVEVNLLRSASAVGTVLIDLRADNAGSPGDVLATTSVAGSTVAESAAYCAAYFAAAPQVTSGSDYWIVVRGQGSHATGYSVTTTTSVTTAKTSLTSGDAWTAQSYALNVKLSSSTDGGVKGLFRAYRSNGTKTSLFWHGTSLLSVDDGTGATTSLTSSLNASATRYRARLVQDTVYFVNGYEKPYKYDFTSVTQITASPYIPSLIEEHKGLLFYIDAEDKTRLYYTNFAAYDTFTSTDFIYVPAPKSYDSLTAMAKLNGVLYLFANRNKFQLLGSDNATFNLDEAQSQRGTFTQESLVYDNNYIFHADEEGIWQFNGTSEKNLALPFLEDYLALPHKDNLRLELYQNRLYVFHTPVGGSDNTRCFVINLALDVYESLDADTFVGGTIGRHAQDDLFIQASNRVGALYYAEQETNDYDNLGGQLNYELRTSYSHFDSPGKYKRAPKWRPVFTSQIGQYSVQAGYAKDLGESAVFDDVSLIGSGIRFNNGATFDSGAVFAGAQNIEPTSLIVSGEFKRLQRRYQHIAAREPVEFDSEILSVETQRLR